MLLFAQAEMVIEASRLIQDSSASLDDVAFLVHKATELAPAPGNIAKRHSVRYGKVFLEVSQAVLRVLNVVPQPERSNDDIGKEFVLYEEHLKRLLESIEAAHAVALKSESGGHTEEEGEEAAARRKKEEELAPSRPGVKPCPYFVRTGKCSYGATCKFISHYSTHVHIW